MQETSMMSRGRLVLVVKRSVAVEMRAPAFIRESEGWWDQNSASWNQMIGWLRQVDALRAAVSGPTPLELNSGAKQPLSRPGRDDFRRERWRPSINPWSPSPIWAI
jgi:hypothetical protein